MQTAPHQPITSKENSGYRRLRALLDPKHRRKELQFLIEGIKMVEEALRDNAGVIRVIASPSLTQHHGKCLLKLAEHRSVEVFWISDRLLAALSESKTPQPVMAVVSLREQGEEALLAAPERLIVIAHQLQDPGNLGTLIRTAEAAGASGVAITRHTVDPYGAKALRASMGSLLRLPVVTLEDASGFLKRCKEKGFQTVALVLGKGERLYDLDLKQPTVVLVGQEGSGLPESALRNIDRLVSIPMAETIDSLNVGVSGAVFLYEALRQRTARS